MTYLTASSATVDSAWVDLDSVVLLVVLGDFSDLVVGFPDLLGLVVVDSAWLDSKGQNCLQKGQN